MLGFDQAIALLEKHVVPMGSETVALEDASGRFLAENLRAGTDAPRCDVSMMDGYAVSADTIVPDRWIDIVGEARPAMSCAADLQPGQAVRIFTGAPVPPRADCVIMQEYAEREGDRVRFRQGFGPARHIRRAASDFAAGDILLGAGTRLTPAAMVAGAAADCQKVQVGRRPGVAILATGDELVPPGSARDDRHAVAETASFGIAAMCDRIGAHVRLRKLAGDKLATLERLAQQAIDSADCVVVTGGASVGDYDLAKPMFARSGLDLVFSKIAIKPGKPVWLGFAGDTPVLGLPGNPTSALVTARLFLQPLLAALQGSSVRDQLAFLPMTLAGAIPETGTRETFLRAATVAGGIATATNQDSGAQLPLARAEWLIRRPPGSPACEAAMQVDALLF